MIVPCDALPGSGSAALTTEYMTGSSDLPVREAGRRPVGTVHRGGCALDASPRPLPHAHTAGRAAAQVSSLPTLAFWSCRTQAILETKR